MSSPRNREAALDRIAAKYAARPDTHEVRFALHSPSTGLAWGWRDEGAREQHFLASITELFTTTLMMQLRHEGAFTLDDPASALLAPGTLDGIHVRDGIDSSAEITLAELLSHTSGLPDYFEGKRPDGSRFVDDLLREDRGWTARETLDMARAMRPAFAPGGPGKALYSDTNFQILQLVIEQIEGQPYARSVQERIADPLGLTGTYVFSPDTLDRYTEVAQFSRGAEPFDAPRAMASFQADGGGVSTAQDSLRFLRAFMEGDLFPREVLGELTETWRRIFPPLTYGMGIMRFAIPRYMTLRAVPEMIGHSGASGTLLYYVPSKDLYLTGAINQLAKRSLPYKAASELIAAV